MTNEKKYDVVLFGATGFTGKLVASYLNDHAGSPSWAMAGRSQSRLAEARSSLKIRESVGLIEADVSRPASLRVMARQARVVINVVGPFRQLGGEKVVEACVAEKAHYVDLSGETGFNEDLIKRFHDPAKQAGVVVAPSVGLDSLPSDVTTYLAVQHLIRQQGCPGAEEVLVALKSAPIVSAGTVHSAMDMACEDKRQLMFTDAGRLATRKPPAEMEYVGSVWLPQYNGYGASFALGPHNIRTVYRSWSLLQDANASDAYGEQFTYQDTLFGGGWLFNAIQANVGKGAMAGLLYLPPLRGFLRAVVPYGSGPSPGMQRRIKTDMRALARYGRKQSVCSFRAPGDPGYFMTARMISETALALALDHDKLSTLGKQGGVLTAATIGAEAIAERLRKYGKFEITTDAFSE